MGVEALLPLTGLVGEGVLFRGARRVLPEAAVVADVSPAVGCAAAHWAMTKGWT